MKIQILFLTLFFLMTACNMKPDPHPAHPDYTIKKPEVQYKPNIKNLATMIKDLQGSPYVWAEEGPNYFDCSGFTYYLYGSMGIDIPRTANKQARVGKYIRPSQLSYGDLLFFSTNKKRKRAITHVGVYLGNGWFTHASTVRHEVVYSNLFTSRYYKNKLRICRRYLPHVENILSDTTLSPWKAPAYHKQELVKSLPVAVKTDTVPIESTKKAIVIKAPMNQIENVSKEGSYYIQIGSYVGEPKATVIEKIRDQGLAYKIIRYKQRSDIISRLFIGPYKSREDIFKILPIIRLEIEENAFISEIR